MARSIPIIRLYGNLVVSIQIELSDRLILDLKDDIAQEIRKSDVHGLVVEVSGVDLFDSFIARSIQDLAQIAQLLGVRTILAGLNAGMAITLVEMGMGLEVQTALTLESALEALARSRRRETALGPRRADGAKSARDADALVGQRPRRVDRAAERLLAAAAEDDDGTFFARTE